ncbi:MAG: hypothetical protein GY857_10665, partial [Desulfobacula sp.]|nr:hypothetical protein [Desulfobacula sp.]
MYKNILKKTLIIMVLLCAIFEGNLFADTNIKIAILPFSLEARQSNDKLLKEIPLLISKKLELEGTKVVLAQLKE